jgi:hypothetical protein
MTTEINFQVWADAQKALDTLIDQMGVEAYLDWWKMEIIPNLTSDVNTSWITPNLTSDMNTSWKYILDRAQEALREETPA